MQNRPWHSFLASALHCCIRFGILLVTMLAFCLWASQFLPVATASADTSSLNVLDYGAKGDGQTDDWQAITLAMEAAAAANKPLYFPAGTYLLHNELSPPDGVTLTGAGASSVLYMPEFPSHSLTFIFHKANPNRVTIQDLTLKGDGPNMHQGGLYLYGARDCNLSNVTFQNLWYGMKLGDAYRQAQRWNVQGIVATNCRMPMYIQDVEDSSFNDMYLHGVKVDRGLDHCIYMSEGCYRLTFTGVTLLGGGGYGLHLYSGSGGNTSDITFENLRIDATTGYQPMCIGGDYSNILVKNATMRMTANEVCVRVYACNNITFDGISASGGYAFIGTWSGDRAGTINVLNGSYSGQNILSPASDERGISNLTVENVTLGVSSTTTTVRPAPTTTAPTTTTTVRPAPTTTTTVAVALATHTGPGTTSTTATPTATTTTIERRNETTTTQATTTTRVPRTSTTAFPGADYTDAVELARTGTSASFVLLTDRKWSTIRFPLLTHLSPVPLIKRVVFFVDDREIGPDSRPPFQCWHDARSLASGLHNLCALAFDRYGNVCASGKSLWYR